MLLLLSYVLAKSMFSPYLIENVLDCTSENFYQMLIEIGRIVKIQIIYLPNYKCAIVLSRFQITDDW